jgi:hypothetical protein
MANMLKRSKRDYQHEWLVHQETDTDDGVIQVQIWLHDDRWLEVGTYDRAAPPERRWTVTILDRQTFLQATAKGEGKFETRDLAMAQVGYAVKASVKAA